MRLKAVAQTGRERSMHHFHYLNGTLYAEDVSLIQLADEVGTPFDIIQWSDLLKSASALEMYYKRYGRIAPDDVAAFLILDPTFPRAIRYCLIKAEDSLHAISGSERGSYHNVAEKRLGRLRAELECDARGARHTRLFLATGIDKAG